MTTDAKPRRLSLGWLKPPKAAPDGTMALLDHLRELRYRVTVSVMAIVVTTIVCAIFNRALIGFIMWPYHQAEAAARAVRPDMEFQIVNIGAMAPFMLVLSVSIAFGIIAASPVWLYQVWAYIAPALLKHEKRRAVLFMSAALPLFLTGAALGYIVLPKGVALMLTFTPEGMDITNMLNVQDFLALEIKLMVVFGLSFLLPVILVTLNLLGIVRGYQLGKVRAYAIFGTFIFGAVATPGGDPFSMLMLAMPMALLYIVAEIICRSNDKRRGISEADAIAVSGDFKIDVDDGK